MKKWTIGTWTAWTLFGLMLVTLVWAQTHKPVNERYDFDNGILMKGKSGMSQSGTTLTVGGSDQTLVNVVTSGGTVAFDGTSPGGITSDPTNGNYTLSKTTAGTVTLLSKDNDANADFVVKAGGTGALTLGNASNTSLTLTTDGGSLIVDGPNVSTGTGGTFTVKRSDAGTVTIDAADNDATAALTVKPGGAALLTLGGASATSIDMTTDGGTVTIDGSITTPAAGVITGSTSVAVSGSTGTLTVKAQGGIVTAPATQTIAATNTITADACGGLKQVTAGSAVTTNTTDTFTAPAAANTGCVMDVCNVGVTNTITLDKNAHFFTQGAADVALAANTCVRIGSDGTQWRQLTAIQTSS